AGEVAKLVNNGLFVAHVALAAIALDLGEEFGVAADVLAALLAASSGTSAGLQALGPLTTTEWGKHAWKVLTKDVDLLASALPNGPNNAIVELASTAVHRFASP